MTALISGTSANLAVVQTSGSMLVLLFLAIMDPLVTMYMDEILARFVEGVTIVLPPPSSALAIGQFLGHVAELGDPGCIGISMGSVASEKANGVASFVVTRPPLA